MHPSYKKPENKQIAVFFLAEIERKEPVSPMMMYLKRYAYDIAMGSQFPPKSPLLESTNRGQKQRSEIEADPEEERRGREIESIEG